MELIDVVKKLTGPVTATGSHEVDEHRLENLHTLIELVDGLIMDIIDASEDKDRHERSMMAIGQEAYCYLKDVKEFLEERV